MIPDFGTGSKCETENHIFCWGWVQDHWGDTLQPALLQHLKLTVIAVAIGFVIAFASALVAYRYRRLDQPIGLFSDFLYTIPSLALFQLLVPLTGLTVTTVEVALVSYTLLILYRNILEGLRGVPRGGPGGGPRHGADAAPDARPRRAPARGAVDHRRPADRDRLDDLDRHRRRVRHPAGARLADLHRDQAGRCSRRRSSPRAALTILLALGRRRAPGRLAQPRAHAAGGARDPRRHLQLGDLPGRDPLHRRQPGPALGQVAPAARALGRGARDRARDRAAARGRPRPPPPRLVHRDQRRPTSAARSRASS